MTDEAGNNDEKKRAVRELPPAALRALKEAEERRAAGKGDPQRSNTEKGGPAGKEPTRYGDWEFKGRAIDF